MLPRANCPSNALAGSDECITIELWRASLDHSRPIYHCPQCSRSAMQFYRLHSLHPDRKALFLCHACDGMWEIRAR
jgi:hypothetical protein